MNQLTRPCKVMVLLGIVCCCFVGCGRSKQGQLPTAQVTGLVKYQGKPLAQAMIKFIPAETSTIGARVAYGTLDENGRYSLGTYGRGDGAVEGEYLVAIEPRQAIAADTGGRVTKYTSVRTRPLIPGRYADPSRSGLTAHVAAGSNTINFELKD